MILSLVRTWGKPCSLFSYSKSGFNNNNNNNNNNQNLNFAVKSSFRTSSVQHEEEKHTFSFYFEKGEDLLDKHQYEESLKAFHKALELSPNNPKIFHEIGMALFQMGEREESLKYFDKVYELQPKDLNISEYQKAASCQQLGDFENAIKHYEKAQSTTTHRDPMIQISIGECYQLLKKPTESIRYYREALELISEQKENEDLKPILFHNLAIAYMELKEFETALQYIQFGLTFESTNFELLKLKAHCYYRTKNYRKSYEAYSAALEIFPDDDECTTSRNIVFKCLDVETQKELQTP